MFFFVNQYLHHFWLSITNLCLFLIQKLFRLNINNNIQQIVQIMGCSSIRQSKFHLQPESPTPKLQSNCQIKRQTCNNLEIISPSVRQTIDVKDGNFDDLFISIEIDKLFKKCEYSQGNRQKNHQRQNLETAETLAHNQELDRNKKQLFDLFTRRSIHRKSDTSHYGPLQSKWAKRLSIHLKFSQ